MLLQTTTRVGSLRSIPGVLTGVLAGIRPIDFPPQDMDPRWTQIAGAGRESTAQAARDAGDADLAARLGGAGELASARWITARIGRGEALSFHTTAPGFSHRFFGRADRPELFSPTASPQIDCSAYRAWHAQEVARLSTAHEASVAAARSARGEVLTAYTQADAAWVAARGPERRRDVLLAAGSLVGVAVAVLLGLAVGQRTIAFGLTFGFLALVAAGLGLYAVTAASGHRHWLLPAGIAALAAVACVWMASYLATNLDDIVPAEALSLILFAITGAGLGAASGGLVGNERQSPRPKAPPSYSDPVRGPDPVSFEQLPREVRVAA